MNRFRLKLTFDSWTQEEYDIARQFTHQYSDVVRLDDEYPAFWIWIDSGDSVMNLELADRLLTTLRHGV
jgi:hypothetical protein